MNFGSVIWGIVILVVVIRRLLKGAREGAKRQGGARAEKGFEAAPEEIQAFLRSLTAAKQQRAAGVQERPAVAAGQRPAQASAPRAAEPTFWKGKPVRQPMPVVTPRPQPRTKRTKARKQKPVQRRKSPPREVLAAREPAAAPKPTHGRAAPVLGLRGTDLKRAVVWSEVLGPPVSLRRNRRLPLGPQQ